jgi:hypothetical protein
MRAKRRPSFSAPGVAVQRGKEGPKPEPGVDVGKIKLSFDSRRGSIVAKIREVSQL